VLSENGSPSQSFTSVTATLEDFYFTVVNQ
jgi:hypothetical protein